MARHWLRASKSAIKEYRIGNMPRYGKDIELML